MDAIRQLRSRMEKGLKGEKGKMLQLQGCRIFLSHAPKKDSSYESLSLVNCYTSNTKTEGSKFISEGIRCVMKSRRRARRLLIEKKLILLYFDKNLVKLSCLSIS